MSDQETRDSGSEQSKKPHTKPRLIEYGPVEKLTRSGTKNHGDAGPMMMSCL